MWRNTIKSSLRSLLKNRSHALINLAGLSLGISSAIILFLVVRFELSFDDYHKNKDSIYRVVRIDNQEYRSSATYPLIDAIRNDFPDIAHVTITDTNEGDPVFGITQPDGTVERFKETPVAFVDPDFFKMFDYKWVEGGEDALYTEKTIVLNRTLADKYFGGKVAVGKVIRYNDQYDLTVSGVVDDAPSNTELPFHAFISYRLGADKHGWDDWDSSSSSINCFIQLKDGANKEELEAKMKGWHLKYFTEKLRPEGEARTYFLQALTDIHFDDRFSSYSGRIVSKTTIWSLALIGGLLLLTACINFINLNTVLIFNRAKEVGIRKTLGGTRSLLLGQFLSETFLIAVISMIVSLGVVELALIKLTPLLGFQLEFRPLTDPFALMLVLGFPFVITIVAGLYPALSLASFNPIKALKNRLEERQSHGFTLRRSLIVVQLMISQALIICTIVVLTQMNYFMSQPLGLNSEAVVEFEIPENRKVDVLTMKDRMITLPGVQSVALSNTGSTGANSWEGDIEAVVKGELIEDEVAIKFADKDYVATYQLELLAGENFNRSDSADRFLINEAFVKRLGLSDNEEAIGIPLNVWGRKALVSGVVANFHAESLKDEILPLVIASDKKGYFKGGVKLSTRNTKETIKQIEKIWQDYFPAFVFEYTFLDETISKYYEQERRTSNLLTLFSGVAILIGCIGLFGLISFMAAKRTKEVGIRKTLGATVAQIVVLFTKEFVVLLLVSFVIAAPLSYYFMNGWLSNFAFRVDITIGMFLLSIGILFVIVLLTTGIKSFRAASANPVNSLKDE
ncbi:MAG: ABC transporter permease [Cyclobacteriaceae bacterium]